MTEEKNIVFLSQEIAQFYSTNRSQWEELYDSERFVFNSLDLRPDTEVIDLGCGCGGLGNALKERFGITSYRGVDISTEAIESGRARYPWQQLLNLDLLDIPESGFPDADLVVSLSCIDWNTQTDSMLTKMWSLVRPGGHAVVSVRLTSGKSITTLSESFQYVNFSGRLEGEIAPYKIFNYREWLSKVCALAGVAAVSGNGYAGPPSVTAVTPVEEVFFAVFAIRKRVPGEDVAEIEVTFPELECLW